MATQPLIFDDTTNKQGICQDIDFLCCSNSVSFPKEDKVRLVNLGLDSVCDLIQTVDTNWCFDDSGNTDSPIGYEDTVANQQSYSIDNDFLSIRGVYINQGDDTYKELEKVDRKKIMESTGTGLPTGYWIDGNYIFFDKTPDTTTTGNSTTKLGYGFKVLFQRSIKYVNIDSTSFVMGYNPLFYRLAALYAARDYAMVNSLDTLNPILLQIGMQEQRLKQNYGRRNKTQNNRFSVRYESMK